MGKQSFVMYKSWAPLFLELDQSEAGELIQAIMRCQSGENVTVSKTIKPIFAMIKTEMDKDAAKYQETCESRAESGKKGGLAKASKIKQMVANGSKSKQKVANVAESESESESESENNLKDSCAEPSPAPVIKLPLNDGSEHAVTQSDVDEYRTLYPAVDVEQELRNMLGWLRDNPTRKKTQSGIRRFIGGWLSKEQNKGRHPPASIRSPDRQYASTPERQLPPGVNPFKEDAAW